MRRSGDDQGPGCRPAGGGKSLRRGGGTDISAGMWLVEEEEEAIAKKEEQLVEVETRDGGAWAAGSPACLSSSGGWRSFAARLEALWCEWTAGEVPGLRGRESDERHA
jgi:hypothetical protein